MTCGSSASALIGGDVEMGSENHPFIRMEGSVSEPADVVPLWILIPLPIRVLVALNVDLEAPYDSIVWIRYCAAS